jgi:hypothetical protein
MMKSIQLNLQNLKISLVIAAALTLLFAAQAGATASTHIWGPSTDIQSFRLWHITSDFYIPIQKDDAGNHPAAVTNLGLTVGVLPFQKLNAEIGFDHKSGLGAADDYPLYLNFKVGFPEKALFKHSPALAVGGFDIGSKKDMTNYNVFYSKIAKTFSAGHTQLGRLSVGFFAGSENLLLDYAGDKDNSGILAAWERTITEISNKLWFCAEYMGTKSAYGAYNIGVAWKFAPNVAVIAGYDLYLNENLVDTATLQVDIDM